MTGPEHYREAERILDEVDKTVIFTDEPNHVIAVSLAEAQVHATLALAAATALNDSQRGPVVADWNAWREVAGSQLANAGVREAATFGQEVALRRKALHMTQAELATSARVSRGTVRNTETGATQPHPSVAKRIEAALSAAERQAGEA